MATDPKTVIAGLIFLGMLVGGIWFVAMRMQANRAAALEAAAPKVAGQDELEGKALNPEQFDEPDDDILDQLGEMLGENDED
ncbi:MAG: hypothetical protein CL992_01740 [Euryarchaeota archaeon]|nr:hypothetical protein [Euryarchaeota archaeon]